MLINNKSKDNWDIHWSNFSISTEENPSQNFRRKIIFNILNNEKKDSFSLIDFGSGQGDLIKDLTKIFNLLFMFNIDTIPLWWQLIAVAKVKEHCIE